MACGDGIWMMLFAGSPLIDTQYLVKAASLTLWRPEGSGHARALHVGVSLFSLDLEITLVRVEDVYNSELLEKCRRVPMRPF